MAIKDQEAEIDGDYYKTSEGITSGAFRITIWSQLFMRRSDSIDT